MRSKHASHIIPIIENGVFALLGVLFAWIVSAYWRKHYGKGFPEPLASALPVTLSAIIWMGFRFLLVKVGLLGDQFNFSAAERGRIMRFVRRDVVHRALHSGLYDRWRIDLSLLQSSEGGQPILIGDTSIEPELIPHSRSLYKIFASCHELILTGEPGSGKSTLLMELAEKLLDDCTDDLAKPIPVVFSLSTWGLRRDFWTRLVPSNRLDDWMVSELCSTTYHLDRALARKWIQQGTIFPLLDGLDELRESDRKSCVVAISKYILQYDHPPIVITCRAEEFKRMDMALPISDVIEIKSLTQQQVVKCLKHLKGADGLWAYAQENASFAYALRSPYFVWMAVSSYCDGAMLEALERRVAGMKHISLEELTSFYQLQIHTDFVNKQIANGKQLNMRWIRNLAQTVISNRKTIFYYESMNETWISSFMIRTVARIMIIAICGALTGIIGLFVWSIRDMWVLHSLVSRPNALKVWMYFWYPIYNSSGWPVIADSYGRPYCFDHVLFNVIGVDVPLGLLLGMIMICLSRHPLAVSVSGMSQRVSVFLRSFAAYAAVSLAITALLWIGINAFGVSESYSDIHGIKLRYATAIPLYTVHGDYSFTLGEAPVIAVSTGICIAGFLGTLLIGRFITTSKMGEVNVRTSYRHSKNIKGSIIAAIVSGTFSYATLLVVPVDEWITHIQSYFGYATIQQGDAAFVACCYAVIYFGGAYVVGQYCARALIAAFGYGPWKYWEMLEEMCHLKFIRSAGGRGYMFVHPLMRDHLAKHDLNS